MPESSEACEPRFTPAEVNAARAALVASAAKVESSREVQVEDARPSDAHETG